MAKEPQSSSNPPQPLSFPPSHFAKLAPRSYLHAHLSSLSSPRPSGRLPHESRKPHINTGSLTHCNGSAVVRAGDTAVVCGIRAEILNASDVVDYRPSTKREELEQRYGAGATSLEGIKDVKKRRQARKEDAEEMAHLNLLVPNVELSTGCSPSYLPGSPPSPEAQSLSHRILTLLHTSQLLSMDDLRIWYHPPSPSTRSNAPHPPPTPEAPPAPETSMSLDVPNEPAPHDPESEIPESQPQIKAFYTLHITLLILSLSGPPFPTLWTALLAALRNTRLPKAWWDTDRQSVLCSPAISDARALNMNRMPIATGFGIFDMRKDGAGLVSSISTQDEKRKSWMLADIDGFEESVCGEEVTVVVREREMDGGKGPGMEMEIVKIEKCGGGVVGRMEMREIVKAAEERYREVRRAIEGDS
ncbi:MAG: hypothetical protein Q9166_007724 [cf. Caloplaca sp. 2 TL-2023]